VRVIQEDFIMKEQTLSMFVEQVLAVAERKFGPDADPVWLENYAREAGLQPHRRRQLRCATDLF
jgi:hypothetical protein